MVLGTDTRTSIGVCKIEKVLNIGRLYCLLYITFPGETGASSLATVLGDYEKAVGGV